VPIKQETWGKGSDAKVVHIVGGRPGAAGSTGPAAPLAAPPTPPAAAPSAAPAGHNSARMSNVDGKDAMIFVTGVVGRAMGSGKFETQDVPLLAKAALAAWNEIKGGL
jgi:hypothetical protein